MCKHVFVFPEDNPKNLNHDRTLTGKCRCGAIQKAKGMRWLIQREDNFTQQVPYGETQLEFDKTRIMW